MSCCFNVVLWDEFNMTPTGSTAVPSCCMFFIVLIGGWVVFSHTVKLMSDIEIASDYINVEFQDINPCFDKLT